MQSNDVVIEIPMKEVGSRHVRVSRFSEDNPSDRPLPSMIPDEGLRRNGTYRALSDDYDDPENENAKSAGQITKALPLWTRIPGLRRLLVFYLPLAIILIIPIIITSTIAKDARIDDVHLVGLFVWLEIIWAIFWVAWATAQAVPFVFQYIGGFISAGARFYTRILKAVERPMTAFIWALFSHIASPILCVFDGSIHGVCDDAWVLAIRKALLATFACTALWFVEKILIHLLVANHSQRQFAAKSEETEQVIQALILLWEASEKLYPPYCQRFVAEDRLILGSENLVAKRSRSLKSSGVRKTIKKIYGKSAMAETKSRLLGEEVLDPSSSRSIVRKALDNEASSEALARRLWLSFVSDDGDSITEADVERVLGSDKVEESLDIFDAFDYDGNGDVSLEEMVQRVVQTSHDSNSLSRNMRDIGRAAKSLDRILEVMLLGISAAIIAAFFSIRVASSVTTVWAGIAAISFAIALTVQEFLGSLIFIFVKHPCDVGERIEINNTQLVVQQIALFYTVFLQVDTGSIIQIPNNVLNTQWIKNISRSSGMIERYDFAISPKTKYFQIENLKKELQDFVLEPHNKRLYQPDVIVEVLSIGDLDRLQLRVQLRSKANFSDDALRSKRRSYFLCALFTALKKHSFSKPWGGRPPDAGTWENPKYNVTLTDAEAATAREQWEAREAKDREEKLGKKWWTYPEKTVAK